MGETQAIINALIQKARQLEPTLADVLIKMANELGRIADKVDPPPTISKKIGSVTLGAPNSVTVFDYYFTTTNVILTWEAPQTGALLYELRQGSTWETATRLFVTGNLIASLDPLLIGDTTFLIKAINVSGVYSPSSASVTVTVPPLGTFSIAPNVINNFVGLAWTAPTSTFRIDYYKITRDAQVIASEVRGTFFVIQETRAGTYTYGITAYDIAGNASSEITVTLIVSNPTDFELEDEMTSTLMGTIVNGKVVDDRLIVCIDITKTWEDHFIDNSFDTPQEQIDAGYPIYIQPTEATASYEEIFDFGIIYTNVIVSLSWLFETIAGSFTFGLEVRVSDDDITYSSPNTSQSHFVNSARYVKVKFTFSGSDDKALLAFSNFICTLFVRREVDGGEADVFAADTGGTVIEFTKAFKFVESITVTPLAVVVTSWSYDFAGGIDPTEFAVLLWNNIGVRIDGHVSWKARGVL